MPFTRYGSGGAGVTLSVYLCIVTQMTAIAIASPRVVRPATAYVSFLAFGSFWGTWGASLPGVKDHAHVSDGQLGAALLFVGAGALPALVLVGRAVDRWGTRTGSVPLSILGLSGVVVALAARGSISLALCLLLVGAASGAADVAMNSAAGSAQASASRPVITRAHGCFSLAVVISSLLTGALRWLGAGLMAPFLLVVVASLTAAAVLWIDARGVTAQPVPVPDPAPARPIEGTADIEIGGRVRANSSAYWTLIGVGLLGALAFAVENAHQSWGAVFLGDTLNPPAGLTAAAPATFAAVAAAARFGAGWTGRVPPARLLLGGGLVVIVGTLTVAAAPNVTAALLGLALAAAGTAVLFPTLLTLVTGGVEESRRGRATSIVSTTAYLGFLLGPVFVGTLAEQTSLRWAFAGVAALAVVFSLTAPPVAARAATRI